MASNSKDNIEEITKSDTKESTTEKQSTEEPPIAELEPMLKKPAVAPKPKKKKPVPRKRQKSKEELESTEVKPIAAPRATIEQVSDPEPKSSKIDSAENQPASEKPILALEPPLPIPRNQSKVSSQFNRQSAHELDKTGESSQVQTFNFKQQPKMAEYDQEQPSPTGFLGWLGLGCSVFALGCLCISFASPYWMQTYPMSFNTFQSMGLWELCMHDYMHHKDDSQEIYNGCWWVFNREEKYWKLREWVLPPWFITCQVLVTMSLLCSVATVVMIGMIFLHCCPIMNHEYHQSYAMFAAAGLCFFNTILTVIVGLMYGLLCGDRQWMPRPDLNFISWGYGFMIIQGIIVTAAGVCYFLEAQKAFNELDRRDQEYTKAVLDLETSAYPPSYGQPSYDAASAGYSDQPPYKESFVSQPSYDPSVQYSGGYPSTAGAYPSTGGAYPSTGDAYPSTGYNTGGYSSQGTYSDKGYASKA